MGGEELGAGLGDAEAGDGGVAVDGDVEGRFAGLEVGDFVLHGSPGFLERIQMAEELGDAVLPGVVGEDAFAGGLGDGVEVGGVAVDLGEEVVHFFGGAEGEAFGAGVEEGGEFALIVGEEEAAAGADVVGAEGETAVDAAAEEVEGGLGLGVDDAGFFAGMFHVGLDAELVPAFADEGEFAAEVVAGGLHEAVAGGVHVGGVEDFHGAGEGFPGEGVVGGVDLGGGVVGVGDGIDEGLHGGLGGEDFAADDFAGPGEEGVGVGVDPVGGEVAVAEEAGGEGALFEGEETVGPEFGEGGEGEVKEVGEAELSGEFFFDVEVPDGVEGGGMVEELDEFGGGDVGAGEWGTGAGFVPPPVDDGDFFAGVAGEGVGKEFAGIGVEEHGGGVAAEDEVDVGGFDVVEDDIPELMEIGVGGFVGVEGVEGGMDEEVVAGLEDGEGDLLGPPDVGADHDGAGSAGSGEELDGGALVALSEEFGPGGHGGNSK